MDIRTVDPNVISIRLARTIGYNLFTTNKLILTEALAVAYSNFSTRPILCL